MRPLSTLLQLFSKTPPEQAANVAQGRCSPSSFNHQHIQSLTSGIYPFTEKAIGNRGEVEFDRLPNPLQTMHGLIQRQPNMAKVVSTLDMLLPRSGTEATFKILDLTVCSNHPVSFRLPTASLFKGEGGNRQFMSSDRLESIRNIVQALLMRPDVVSSSGAIVELGNGEMDLSDLAVSQLISAACSFGQTLNIRPVNWYDSLRSALFSVPDSSDPDVKHFELSDQQRHAVLKLSIPLAHLVSQIDAALILANTQSPDAQGDTYPLFAVDGENVPRRQMLPTFCDSIHRSASVFDNLQQVQGTTQAWSVQQGGQWRPVDNKAELVLFVADLASRQLQCRDIATALDVGGLLPLPVYYALAELEGIQVPEFILESYEQRNKCARGVEQELTLKHQAELAAKAESQAIRDQARAQRDAQRQTTLETQAQQLKIPPSEYYVMLANSGSSHSITNDTFESTYDVTHCVEQLSTSLNHSHELIDMAASARGKANLARVAERPNEGGFYRDHLCWLRACWVSAFEQIASSQQPLSTLDQGFEHAQLRLDGNSLPEQYMREIYKPENIKEWLESKQIFKAYQQNPLSFLHSGEEDRALTAPAHFRTGEALEDFLTSWGIETPQQINPKLYPPPSQMLIDEVTRAGGDPFRKKTVESSLKTALLHLAAGVRGSVIRDVQGLTLPGTMATTDVPLAMHRALNLPVIVLEKSRYSDGPAQIRIAGPNSHTLKALEIPSDCTDIVLRPHQWDLLKALMNELPVIQLQGDHYTVHIPKTGKLGQQISQQYSQTVPMPPEPVTQLSPALSASSIVSSGADYPLHEAALVTYPQNGQRPSQHLVSANLQTEQSVRALLEFTRQQSGDQPLVVEFVSARAGIQPERSLHPGLRYALSCMLSHSNGPIPLTQDGDWHLTQIRPQAPGPNSKPWERHFVVTLATPFGETREIKILELSPAFDGRALSQEDLLYSHQAMQANLGEGATPIILSTTGRLRAGALSVLAAWTSATHRGGNVSRQIDELMAHGQRDRGPSFLRSQSMLACVKAVAQSLAAQRQ
ncbi:MAG: hypothetical protein QE278_10755 [Limnobacter sp.]|nr:hypothetical protein [Limnobacter sp.]